MKLEQITVGKKYMVNFFAHDLHYFKPGSTVTVEKIKSANQINCCGFSKTDNTEIFQHLFPEQLSEIPDTKIK